MTVASPAPGQIVVQVDNTNIPSGDDLDPSFRGGLTHFTWDIEYAATPDDWASTAIRMFFEEGVSVYQHPALTDASTIAHPSFSEPPIPGVTFSPNSSVAYDTFRGAEGPLALPGFIDTSVAADPAAVEAAEPLTDFGFDIFDTNNSTPDGKVARFTLVSPVPLTTEDTGILAATINIDSTITVDGTSTTNNQTLFVYAEEPPPDITQIDNTNIPSGDSYDTSFAGGVTHFTYDVLNETFSGDWEGAAIRVTFEPDATIGVYQHPLFPDETMLIMPPFLDPPVPGVTFPPDSSVAYDTFVGSTGALALPGFVDVSISATPPDVAANEPETDFGFDIFDNDADTPTGKLARITLVSERVLSTEDTGFPVATIRAAFAISGQPVREQLLTLYEVPAPGSCCFPDGTCIEVLEDECLAMPDSIWGGDASSCSDATCVPPNDLCADATPLAFDTSYAAGTWAASGDGAADCGGSAPDVWYQRVGDATTWTLSISDAASARVQVYEGTCAAASCAFDQMLDSATSLSFCTGLSVNYLIRVTEVDGAVGNFSLSLTSDGAHCCRNALNQSCATDLNNDCRVNNAELGLLLASYLLSSGEIGFNPSVDFNGDQIVNNIDLGILLSEYLNDCN